MQKLINIQSALKAPKSQNNSFGGYKYRSCEDILEAVKHLLNEQGLLLTITDNVEMIGNRYYVKATATVTDGEKTFSTSAYAREEETKKGMDASQITGSASSYARKYALNGLFAIDDTKDADYNNGRQSEPKPQQQNKPAGAFKCSGCGAEITENVFKFSQSKFGKPLCMDCQKKAK